ncbi:MAG: hypothetical protein DMD62_04815 [Gemmatimonadetes bacterium]|nr:MAG: hypothetical protein DMD62_04815 [Gemmatimonadota bacterium]
MSWGVYPVVRICAVLIQVQTVGSDAEDRLRLAQLLGTSSSEAFLLRSDVVSMRPGDRPTVRLLPVELSTVYNTTLPFSLNDGAMWAGRGWNQMLRLGVGLRWRHVTLVLAPALVSAENLAYPLPADSVQLPRPPGRSSYSTPWHVGAYSIDLPLRFGTRGFTGLDAGQSTLAADLGPVTMGVSSANAWWGPGIRNAIVLSNNAPGIWRAFVNVTGKRVSARWFLGGLFESPYFDSTSTDDARAMSALAITWAPRFAPNLTLGAARAVYAPLSAWSDIGKHAFDVARGNGARQRNQIFSLFGRWVFPADGFAVHAEWARSQLPRSVRELLISPNHTLGYTMGLEWARPLGAAGAAFRMQAEVTDLEKSPAYRNLPEETWYTGDAAPQGYTQRGQVIGAAIGPAASTQWLAWDYVAPRWRAGLFVGRIRWDDDALFLTPGAADEKRLLHDVSVFGGARAATQSPLGLIEATLTAGRRLNLFYEESTIGTTTLALRFTP